MADFGGIMRFTFGGSPLVMRGKFSTQPASQKADEVTNRDGSTSRTMTPKGFGAEVTFEDSNSGVATAQNWDGILLGGPYNMTVVEENTNIVHTWTSASFTGDVSVDRENGEVTGLKIHGSTYNTSSGA